MIFRGNRIRRPALRVGPRDSPICARRGCGHPRLKHYTTIGGLTGCNNNQVWPHTDPETGQHVPASHCACPGFLALSTRES